MNNLVRIVVGFDALETIAHHVFCQSVLEKTSLPVSFLPLIPTTDPDPKNLTIKKYKNPARYFTYRKRGHAVKKSRFTPEQIAFALKQAETDTRIDEICRKMGISDATFYKWRQKYGGEKVWMYMLTKV